MLWCKCFLVQVPGVSKVLPHMLKHWGHQEYFLLSHLLNYHYLLHLMHILLLTTAACFLQVHPLRLLKVNSSCKLQLHSSYYLPLPYSITEITFHVPGKDRKFIIFIFHFVFFPFSHFLMSLCSWFSFTGSFRGSISKLCFSVLHTSMYCSLIISGNVCSLSTVI